jgi:hypothetical protein
MAAPWCHKPAQSRHYYVLLKEKLQNLNPRGTPHAQRFGSLPTGPQSIILKRMLARMAQKSV